MIKVTTMMWLCLSVATARNVRITNNATRPIRVCIQPAEQSDEVVTVYSRPPSQVVVDVQAAPLPSGNFWDWDFTTLEYAALDARTQATIDVDITHLGDKELQMMYHYTDQHPHQALTEYICGAEDCEIVIKEVGSFGGKMLRAQTTPSEDTTSTLSDSDSDSDSELSIRLEGCGVTYPRLPLFGTPLTNECMQMDAATQREWDQLVKYSEDDYAIVNYYSEEGYDGCDDLPQAPVKTDPTTWTIPKRDLQTRHGQPAANESTYPCNLFIDACHLGLSHAMRWMLAHGADPNARDESGGYTALYLALFLGSCKECVMQLLAAGADTTAKALIDGSGDTAVERCRSLMRVDDRLNADEKLRSLVELIELYDRI